MKVSITEPEGPGVGSEMVYRNLRREILRLELLPGSELDEASVATRYRVSRTPVREALIRLTAEGLVTATKGRGARVAALDLQNLRAFFEGLDILQRAVTRLAALRRRPADLETIEMHMLAFEEGARRLDSETVNEANYEFHAAIGEAAASGYLANAYRRSLIEGMRIGFVCFSDHSDIDERLETHLGNTMQDHRRMFEAVAAGDPDAAEAHAGAHVELFRGRIVTALLSTDTVRRVAVRQEKS
ncbi:DNA-binding GntR family transcriptional regulator [Mesorhizobium sp. J18]|uniref:GntR family transcriptional regulator n=1 Tax=Mesorhizobium sp. J18 TaxID=935263 RepID=UPI00119C5F50|nr:GntR family transcriptional regulator [Mesorhizobium sp. J18]TWG98908.1 DNA-binding GntR family transcriptional regulator [Mesorhizobium sp. J18]